MDTKLWVDDICQLFTLDINPFGASSNAQINIITKLALLISAIVTSIKRESAPLKRTIIFIALVMGVYILFSGMCAKNKQANQSPPSGDATERFGHKDTYDNPVGNPELKTAILSSPATGSPSGMVVQTPACPSRILGCSVNTDDWSHKNPDADDTRVSGGNIAHSISPEIEAALTHNMPLDPSDEFYGSNFSRQVYRIADDQGNYASSLYSQGAEQQCKQGSVFAHLGNPYTVYSQACSGNNGYGQSRRTGLHLPAK